MTTLKNNKSKKQWFFPLGFLSAPNCNCFLSSEQLLSFQEKWKPVLFVSIQLDYSSNIFPIIGDSVERCFSSPGRMHRSSVLLVDCNKIDYNWFLIVYLIAHRGGIKLHLQSGQFVGLNQTAGEVSTPWKLADVIAHLSSQTASTWLSFIVQTFNHWKKTKKNINHWKNNFDGQKKTSKISTIKKIISMVEKNTKNINHQKKKIEQVQSQILTIEKKNKKKLTIEKKNTFFLCFFSTTKKQSHHWFFVLFFLSRTERKVEKSVWEWVLRCFEKKKKIYFSFHFFIIKWINSKKSLFVWINQ